jgi:hypothetical protein
MLPKHLMYSLILAASFICTATTPRYPQAFPSASSISLVASPIPTEAGATCPVTKPPSSAFVPPSPYPRETAQNQFWFGSDKLWTALPTDGTWKLGHYTPDDPSFRQKMLWWRRGYDRAAGDPPELTVMGKRLDSAAPPLATDEHANAGWTNDPNHPFMVTGINVPKVGCWQITGDYKGDKLTFVVNVEGFEK